MNARFPALGVCWPENRWRSTTFNLTSNFLYYVLAIQLTIMCAATVSSFSCRIMCCVWGLGGREENSSRARTSNACIEDLCNLEGLGACSPPGKFALVVLASFGAFWCHLGLNYQTKFLVKSCSLIWWTQLGTHSIHLVHSLYDTWYT